MKYSRGATQWLKGEYDFKFNEIPRRKIPFSNKFDNINHDELEKVFLNIQNASLVFSHYKCERYDSKFKSIEFKSKINACGNSASQAKERDVIESLYFNEKAWNAVYDSAAPSIK